MATEEARATPRVKRPRAPAAESKSVDPRTTAARDGASDPRLSDAAGEEPVAGSDAERSGHGPRAPKPAGRAARARRSSAPAEDAVVAGVRITHPDRVLYPDEGITKLEIARYYVAVAPHLLPFIRRRPLSLVRCPQGAASTCFFQKHATAREIPGIDYVLITESGGEKPYVLANTAQALAGLAQMGTLELHGWNATADDVERADMMVFDFDPDVAVPFAAVPGAAVRCRTLLAALGLESFAKTTGGKGLHVVVPLSRRVGWPTVKKFARAIAEELERSFPDEFTTKAAKAARKGKIFVDYLRNGRGATAVAPYSVRARAGATVAVPLYWNEVRQELDPTAFDVRSVEVRLAAGGDPWAGYRTLRQTITVEMQRQLERAR